MAGFDYGYVGDVPSYRTTEEVQSAFFPDGEALYDTFSSCLEDAATYSPCSEIFVLDFVENKCSRYTGKPVYIYNNVETGERVEIERMV